MNVLVTGAGGQLGSDVVIELNRRGHTVFKTDLPELDLTDEAAVFETIRKLRPDAVIHCAGWTAVDAAEDAENHDIVFKVNALGTKYIAQACADVDAKMVYISTDYVFDGTGTEPREPDSKEYAPINVYGQSKLDGERAVAEAMERFFIVRTAWVFGKNGSNFVKTMLKVGKSHRELRVVNDQVGTPTYTPDLARLLVDMVQTEKYGFYHATNEGGFLSWADFAGEIFRQAAAKWPESGYDAVAVLPVTTEEYGLSKAQRPFNSRLSKVKLSDAGFVRLPDWRDALSRYLDSLEEKELT